MVETKGVKNGGESGCVGVLIRQTNSLKKKEQREGKLGCVEDMGGKKNGLRPKLRTKAFGQKKKSRVQARQKIRPNHGGGGGELSKTVRRKTPRAIKGGDDSAGGQGRKWGKKRGERGEGSGEPLQLKLGKKGKAFKGKSR